MIEEKYFSLLVPTSWGGGGIWGCNRSCMLQMEILPSAEMTQDLSLYLSGTCVHCTHNTWVFPIIAMVLCFVGRYV